MRSPLLLVVFLALAPAAPAAPGARPGAPAAQDAPADWRRDVQDERIRQALLAKGWRLEDDGKALDPETKAPATKAALVRAAGDILQDARRAALETVNLMYAPGYQAGITDEARKRTIASELPPGLAAAILDPNSDPAKIRAMADAELDKVAAYFDGGRTLADRQAAAQPVAAVPLGTRVNLPYYNAAEQNAGEKLRASAASAIGRDPFGRTVLSRLNDSSGKPSLPAFLVEDAPGGTVAHYDYRRRAVVIDRSVILDAVVETAHPRQRAALRQSLSKRSDLLAYLDAHPGVADAVVRANDGVIVHELTHAWQDRRDTIFREMARGNLPEAQILEYEEEAYKTQNLYVRSKLANDPASVSLEKDVANFYPMVHGRGSWLTAIYDEIRDASPSRGLDLPSVRKTQTARLARTKARGVATAEEQTAKSLDLQGLTRANRALAALEIEHARRVASIDKSLDEGRVEDTRLLAKYYLGRALTAERSTDRAAWLDQAERYAKSIKDKKLLEEIGAARKPK